VTGTLGTVRSRAGAFELVLIDGPLGVRLKNAMTTSVAMAKNAIAATIHPKVEFIRP
jgi:hypothetical protein